MEGRGGRKEWWGGGLGGGNRVIELEVGGEGDQDHGKGERRKVGQRGTI